MPDSRIPEDESHWLHSNPLPNMRPCLFFKLVVASILQEKKLKIPGKFVRKYGNELSDFATLTLPNGNSWIVELRKQDHKLWFQNGWNEFVKHYNIRVGYLLVFRYEGKSNFNVHLYDLTLSEIKYPCITLNNFELSEHHKRCAVPREKEIEDAKSKIFDECVAPQTHCENHKRAKFKYSTNGADVPNLHLQEGDNLQATVQYTGGKGIQFDRGELIEMEDGVGLHFSNDANRKSRRKQIAELYKRCELISSQHEVKLNKDAEEHELSDKQCVELEVPSLKVSSTISIREWIDLMAEGKRRAMHAAEMFNPSNPFFRVILQRSYLRKNFLLHIPSGFALKYLRTDSNLVKLQTSGGKQWPVRCMFYNRAAKFSKGWTEFARENNLKEGDVCVFELIDEKNFLLKVTIFRVFEDAELLNQPSK